MDLSSLILHQALSLIQMYSPFVWLMANEINISCSKIMWDWEVSLLFDQFWWLLVKLYDLSISDLCTLMKTASFLYIMPQTKYPLSVPSWLVGRTKMPSESGNQLFNLVWLFSSHHWRLGCLFLINVISKAQYTGYSKSTYTNYITKWRSACNHFLEHFSI